MRIECPKCHFSANVDPNKIPSGKAKVKCPKCGERFQLNRTEPSPAKEAPPADFGAPEPHRPKTSAPIDFNEEVPDLSILGKDLDSGPDAGPTTQPSSGGEAGLPPSIGLDSGPPDLSLLGQEPDLPPSIGLESNESGVPSAPPMGEKPELEQWGQPDPAGMTSSVESGADGRMPSLENEFGLMGNMQDGAAPGATDWGGSPMERPEGARPPLKLLESKSTSGAPMGGPRGTGGKGGNSGPEPVHQLTFTGNGKTLLGIYVVNMLLTVATLGIYYSWAKVKTRKYLYSSSELMKERFTFTGTGRELFIGKIKATVVLAVLFGGPQVLAEKVNPAFAILVFPAMLLLTPIAKVSTMRYRFCRTLWHNVQFSFRGTIKEGIKLYIFGTFLTIVTLGFYYPFFYTDKQNFWRGNSYFGSEAFSYDGKGKEVFGTLFLGAILTPLTFGLYWFWMKAKLTRYDWEHTSFQGVRFISTVTGANIIGLKLVNLLIISFTLGLGYPWVVIRNMEFNFRHLSMEGHADLSKIIQSKENAQAVGEGLLDHLDMDFAI